MMLLLGSSHPKCKIEALPAAAEEVKAEKAGRELLREMSRSPSIQKERCYDRGPPEKGPSAQCRLIPHKILQVC